MKVGLVYYTRTGNTRNAAQLIQKKLMENHAEVDLIEIEHMKRPGFFSAGRAAMKDELLEIKNMNYDLGQYEVILAGSPTWAGRPSPYLKLFITKAENINGKRIAFFGTGSSPIDKRDQFIEMMKHTAQVRGAKPMDSFLVFTYKRGRLADGEQHVDNFVENILK